MLSSLDHVALAVQDLDGAVGQYRSLLGREPGWRGVEGGAAHAWFQLANMALDIIAPAGSGPGGDAVSARLQGHGEGLWAMAFVAPDLQKALRALARRNVNATDVALNRDIERKASLLAAEGTHGPTIFVTEPGTHEQSRAESPFSVDRAAGMSGLDHVVVTTTHPNRAAAFYGARLGLDMALDRSHAEWGARLMFFRCGDLIVEVAHDLRKEPSDDPDRLWGLSWRAVNIDATQARLAQSGFDVSSVRTGRKPGTRVFTVRDRTCNVPTIVIGRDDR